MARIAVLHCDDPEVTARVKAVMRHHLAELQNEFTWPNGTQLSFHLMPGCDLAKLDHDLDTQCGTGYRGKIADG